MKLEDFLRVLQNNRIVWEICLDHQDAFLVRVQLPFNDVSLVTQQEDVRNRIRVSGSDSNSVEFAIRAAVSNAIFCLEEIVVLDKISKEYDRKARQFIIDLQQIRQSWIDADK